MHLIKIVACNTLQSFQSVFYAQCNAQKKELFLASFWMELSGAVYASRAVAHLQGVVLRPENHTKTGFVPRCLHSK